MDKDRKRAALTAYRLTKPAAGIYELRFAGADSAWLGATRDVSKIENRHRFELRIGSHRCASLQQAWLAQGGEAFACRVLETIDEETPAISVDRVLKERLDHWLGATGGIAL